MRRQPREGPQAAVACGGAGGVPIGKMIMGNTNPAKSANCFRPDCGVCASGGKRCAVSGVTYKYVCQKESTVGGSDNGTAQRHSEGNSTDVTEEPEIVKCELNTWGRRVRICTVEICGTKKNM